MPPLTVVLPLKVLLPESVSVPVPVLMRLSVDVVPEFLRAPLKVLVWLVEEKTVRVAFVEARRLSMMPAPDRPLMISELPLRSSVPSTVTLPLDAPSGMTSAAPSFSVPALTVVAPM